MITCPLFDAAISDPLPGSPPSILPEPETRLTEIGALITPEMIISKLASRVMFPAVDVIVPIVEKSLSWSRIMSFVAVMFRTPAVMLNFPVGASLIPPVVVRLTF